MKKIIAIMILIVSTQVSGNTGEFGIGAIFGAPTGISGNYILDENRSIDGGLGFSLSNSSDTKLEFHSTLLSHKPDSLKAFGQVLGWYYGLGGKIKIVNKDNGGDSEFRIGARASLGAKYDIIEANCDFFAEAGLIMEFIPDTNGSLDIGIGARYYF